MSRPKSSPALEGFHCGKLDDCDSGVLKRQTSDQPFRWMLSCVGGDRSDVSPRSVGPHGGFEVRAPASGKMVDESIG